MTHRPDVLAAIYWTFMAVLAGIGVLMVLGWISRLILWAFGRKDAA